MAVIVCKETCTGCEQCVDECPFGAIEMVDGIAVINEACTLCGACVDVCEFEALEMEEVRSTTGAADLSAYQGIWVFAEQRRGVISSVVLELLNEGRRLADQLDTHLAAVLLGHDTGAQAQWLLTHGADRVFVADDAVL
ncbi:MAG: 4Fe-4S binding protein, partial [bacterium]|nr:4Fe-4S binding protein [bacterium]